MRRLNRFLGWFVLSAAFVAVPAFVIAQAPIGKGPVRARPPKFPKSVTDLFSADAKDSLQGDRPDFQSGTSSGTPVVGGNPGTTTQPPNGSGGNSGSPPVPAGAFSWSKLVSADAIEGEIKSYKAQLGDDAKTPGAFKAGGIKKVRRAFTMYAAMFAVISEYDGDVKWKSQALAARDEFARCAINCKAATDGQFQETKRTIEDLETLIGGGTIPNAAAAAQQNDWPKIAERRILMQRMEALHQTDLAAWTANAEDFKKNADKIVKEAQLMAALSEISIKPGYENWNDTKFVEFARALQQSCIEAGESAKNKDYDAARKAVSAGAKACASCHSDYRS